MDKTITLSATYIYRNFYRVLDMVVKDRIKVQIKYKGEICAIFQGV
jgi:hypothetical protein